jgi:hypothetical protein
MKKGANISFYLNNKKKYGKIIKIYTKVGFEDHGEEFVVVSLHGDTLKFYEGVVEINKKQIKDIL